MKILTSFFRFISLLLVPCLVLGCTGYNRSAVVLPKDGLLPVEKKVVLLHRGDDTVYLTEVKLINWCLEATPQPIPAGSCPKKDEVLHIYLDPSAQIQEFGMAGSLPATLSIPYTAIEKVEFYEVSTGKTVGYTAVVVGAIAGGAVLLIVGIGLASIE